MVHYYSSISVAHAVHFATPAYCRVCQRAARGRVAQADRVLWESDIHIDMLGEFYFLLGDVGKKKSGQGRIYRNRKESFRDDGSKYGGVRMEIFKIACGSSWFSYCDGWIRGHHGFQGLWLLLLLQAQTSALGSRVGRKGRDGCGLARIGSRMGSRGGITKGDPLHSFFDGEINFVVGRSLNLFKPQHSAVLSRFATYCRLEIAMGPMSSMCD